MIEVRNLTKTYRPKKGVPVRAIDGVSLTLPDRGMVFLLGKSGSGKSTLLNLLGGLDRYDSGDILVNGMSTRAFRQVHFDSYRNTYVGFIFQEYNLLDEFTVGANIALAIELQGRRAEDREINDILQEVDLAGYGNRRTNELSGGQKQRVAIARALVKKPEIIMADEPSGALDAATGRAVFETLKNLSAERLVIVVSHDREFAETYGDRIIELADGCVISDCTAERGEEPQSPTLTYTEEGIEIPADYVLTEEDRLAINAYLKDRAGGKLLPQKTNTRFKETKNEAPIPADGENGTGFHLIKSRLPLRAAFRIGAGALGYKKVRLVFTVLLSVVAFVLFGLSDTVASYNHLHAATQSIVDSNVRYAAFEKTEKYSEDYYQSGLHMTDSELAEVREKTGLPLIGVYTTVNSSVRFSQHYRYDSEGFKEQGMLFDSGYFSGFAEIGENTLGDAGYTLLAGQLPDGAKDEILISDYIYQFFRIGGYVDTDGQTETVSAPADMVGKTLVLDGIPCTVTGVVDTDFDLDRYSLLTKDFSEMGDEDYLIYVILAEEFRYERNYSFASIALCGEGFLTRYTAQNPNYPPIRGNAVFERNYLSDGVDMGLWVEGVATPEHYDMTDIQWLGEAKTELAPGEIVVSRMQLYFYQTDTGKVLEGEDFNNFLLQNPDVQVRVWGEKGESEGDAVKEFRIVGLIPEEMEYDKQSTLICSSADYGFFVEDDGVYSYAVAAMPDSRVEIEHLVRLSMADTEYRFELINNVIFELNMISEALTVLGGVFFYVGLAFAIFAALLFSNFIATSVTYKKQEIGILRAIGSRSNDVFRIFFAESFIIAMINFALATLGTFLLAGLVNTALRDGTGLLITILSFGVRQVLLLFLISVGVALVASFLPVRSIAAKRPIDAIRDR